MPSRQQSIPAQSNHIDGPRPLTGRGPSSFKLESFKDALADVPPALLRRLDRGVRLFRRDSAQTRTPRPWLVRVSSASFCLDGLALAESEVAQAVESRPRLRGMSSPRVLRARNHLAILRAIERRARRGIDLDVASVVRWYTSISCGLSISAIAPAKLDYLAQYLRPINSATTRPAQAVFEAASVHLHLIADPLFPGFNGVVARLLLQYHLMRSSLPPVRFDPTRDRELLSLAGERTLYTRLLERVSEACETMVEDSDGGSAPS